MVSTEGPRGLVDDQDDLQLSPKNNASNMDTTMITMTRTQTRQEALDAAGDLNNQLCEMSAGQEALKPQVQAWFTRPRYMVLPHDFKNKVYHFVRTYLNDELGAQLSQDTVEDMEEYTYTEEVSVADLLRYKTKDCLNQPHGDLSAIIMDQPIDKRLALTNALNFIQMVCDGEDELCEWFAKRHDEMEVLVSEQNLDLSAQLSELVKGAKTNVEQTENTLKNAETIWKDVETTFKKAENTFKKAKTTFKKAETTLKNASKYTETTVKEAKTASKDAETIVKEAKTALMEVKTTVSGQEKISRSRKRRRIEDPDETVKLLDALKVMCRNARSLDDDQKQAVLSIANLTLVGEELGAFTSWFNDQQLQSSLVIWVSIGNLSARSAFTKQIHRVILDRAIDRLGE